MKNRTILQGDVLECLSQIESNSIDVEITSPPYLKLRDYGVEGQWGSEATMEEYLEKMDKLMQELKRVLKPTGTCWVNIGDSYGSHRSNQDEKINDNRKLSQEIISDYEKSRLGVPERFYIRAIDNGWIARNPVVWAKPNPMPSSIKDRLTNTWEAVYFFAKNIDNIFWYNEKTLQSIKQIPLGVKGIENVDWEYYPCSRCGEFGKVNDIECKRCKGLGKYKKSLWHGVDYYFNLNAIREKPKTETKPFNLRIREAKKGMGMLKLGDDDRAWKASDGEMQTHNKLGEKISNKKQDNTLGGDGKPKPQYEGFNERWNNRKWSEVKGQVTQTIAMKHTGIYDMDTGESINHPLGKNPGDVIFANYTDEELLEWIQLCRENPIAFDLAPTDLWFITPQAFKEAHFATFPIELPTKILKASCPFEVCCKCGTPKFPIVKGESLDRPNGDELESFAHEKGINPDEGKARNVWNGGTIPVQIKKVEWSKCDCNDEFEAGKVLDPFFGAGTVGLAAEKLGLQWIGIELSQKYIDIAKKRISPFQMNKLF